ncbi:MAG: 5-formyltetrahydrofolate cyclo-ligase, partial [Rhizobiaceae bacterium]|nr:5-formyltetrahydrofolate cyclo-ligase [Rhizobiaceae bacterium]
MPDSHDQAEYASPPCFMHELSPDFRGIEVRSDAWPDVQRWRKAERARLIERRMALAPSDRQVRSSEIARRLDLAITEFAGVTVGSYWPIRGEPDLRDWSVSVAARGGRIALPVVIEKGQPLEYRIWRPGEPLERGVWNILVPAKGPAIRPDIV